MADGYEALYRRILGEEGADDGATAATESTEATPDGERRVVEMAGRTSARSPKAG
jgi:hypothetical protein